MELRENGLVVVTDDKIDDITVIYCCLRVGTGCHRSRRGVHQTLVSREWSLKKLPETGSCLILKED